MRVHSVCEARWSTREGNRKRDNNSCAEIEESFPVAQIIRAAHTFVADTYSLLNRAYRDGPVHSHYKDREKTEIDEIKDQVRE